jgi:uncharacterized protein Yka (UPF0111/DUF47 family)
MQILITQRDDEENKECTETVHKAESKADDLRREIEMELYRKA